MIPTEYQPGHQGCGQTRQRDFPSLRSEMPRLCRSAWWPFKLCDNLFQYPFVTVSAGRYTCSVDDIGDFVHGMTFAVSAKILSTPIMHLIHLSRRMIRQCTCYCLSDSLCFDPAIGVFSTFGAQITFFAPRQVNFPFSGAPDAFFAPHRSGYQGRLMNRIHL